ncbi:TetR-like C-terminal domain-containing protein [Paenibacillus alginolyticus]|uniref:TetR-like C-terminal domain-containing protein n=2 Tax=Paenibacillus alginolyticus TaxID=59839 RepID=UPI000685C7FD|nr:TetR-like C-terminal domain-containing protein [Paenibacillus alginolyticus]
MLDKCIEDHLNQMILSCKFSKSYQKKITDLDEAMESLKALFVFIEDHFSFFSSMISKQKTSIFREGMLKIIKKAIQKQIDMQGINQNMDKELIINYTASAFVGTVEWWILNQMPHSPQTMAEQLADLFKRNNIFDSTKPAVKTKLP